MNWICPTLSFICLSDIYVEKPISCENVLPNILHKCLLYIFIIPQALLIEAYAIEPLRRTTQMTIQPKFISGIWNRFSDHLFNYKDVSVKHRLVPFPFQLNPSQVLFNGWPTLSNSIFMNYFQGTALISSSEDMKFLPLSEHPYMRHHH